jgi:hypothetical protein
MNWYANVGAALSSTMLVQVVAPHGATIAKAFVIGPLKKQVLKGSASTQEEVCFCMCVYLDLIIATAYLPPLSLLYILVMYILFYYSFRILLSNASLSRAFSLSHHVTPST